jgi:tetratricopeptide (TPR) repeat protein
VFNLGLVHRDLGDFEAAIRSFERALALLDSAKVPSQAAGAARELGITLLRAGDREGAIGSLEDGMELAKSRPRRRGRASYFPASL